MKPFVVTHALRRLEDVSAFGDPETGLQLHWYGLTHGVYDVVIDGHGVYQLRSGPVDIDYAVARIWEDLIQVVPFALAPVPEPLAARVADLDAWHDWTGRALEDDETLDIFDVAIGWWSDRSVDSGHFTSAPNIHSWRTGDQMHLSWRVTPGGHEIWASPMGDATMPVAAFVDEMVAFDRRLIAEMGERVDTVERGWMRPEVRIDLSCLRAEQLDRSTWLARALHTPPAARHSWSDVMEAIAELDRHMSDRQS